MGNPNQDNFDNLPVGKVALSNKQGTEYSASNPLPVSATIDTTGLATDAVQQQIENNTDGLEAELATLNAKVTAVNTGAVIVSSSALPTGASTEGTLAAINGKIATLNQTADVNGSGVQAVGMYAQFDDVSPTLLTENNYGNARLSNRRELYVQVRDAQGNERGLAVDSNGRIAISALTGSVNPGTASNQLGKAIDSAVGGTDTGVAVLVQRADSLSTLTPANGDYVPMRVDNQGSLWVRQSGPTTTTFNKVNITTATTTTPKSGGGAFYGIIINKAVAAGTIDIYDNTAASGTKIGQITFGATITGEPTQLLYSASLSTGLTLVTSAAFDLTVMYQ